ncbi:MULTISPECIES: segregation and condensation protein A [Thiorhodovibrio]|uniref:segregation and condensation protein A n=1 Tax=Thiorhodovibrio TaxID=61593 RepID=UPI001913734B|nr:MULTISPECIES: ScpA family protein [Thiorhodovibrio]MBK5968245.1 segregation/condensation protein A [Thiorhodovibrio winogradskyi]WPL14799.1 Segregation and condensation protein A [Thiorhodovibrio litoralis]
MTLSTQTAPVPAAGPPPDLVVDALPVGEAERDALHALVRGQPFVDWPQDLFIPPDALEVFLETFEGPLDLLLYLIRRQNLDILDIPIADITRQYMDYVELMKEMRLDLAAEYLVMAALLCEIKSRMLLPRPESEDQDADDPRAELVRRLLEYERFQQAARKLDELPRMERDWVQTQIEVPTGYLRRIPPQVDLADILLALRAVLERADLSAAHRVSQESLSLRERMTIVLERLQDRGFTPFVELFDATEGRPGVVVTFLAILELIKTSVLELVQADPFASIHVRVRDAANEPTVA